MDFNKIDNTQFYHPMYYPLSVIPRSHHIYSPQLNGVSFALPPVPPLSQYDDIIAAGADLCTPEDVEKLNCSEKYCECTHVIHVELGKVKYIFIASPFKLDSMITNLLLTLAPIMFILTLFCQLHFISLFIVSTSLHILVHCIP